MAQRQVVKRKKMEATVPTAERCPTCWAVLNGPTCGRSACPDRGRVIAPQIRTAAAR